MNDVTYRWYVDSARTLLGRSKLMEGGTIETALKRVVVVIPLGVISAL